MKNYIIIVQCNISVDLSKHKKNITNSVVETPHLICNISHLEFSLSTALFATVHCTGQNNCLHYVQINTMLKDLAAHWSMAVK